MKMERKVKLFLKKYVTKEDEAELDALLNPLEKIEYMPDDGISYEIINSAEVNDDNYVKHLPNDGKHNSSYRKCELDNLTRKHIEHIKDIMAMHPDKKHMLRVKTELTGRGDNINGMYTRLIFV